MTSHVSHREVCRLCGSSNLEKVISLAPTPIADDFRPAERLDEPQESFPLDLWICRQCGFLQHLDIVDPGQIYDEYIYVTTSSPGLVEHFRRYCEEVAPLAPNQGLVVEIGSNDGTLLNFFQSRGFSVLGVEPGRAVSQLARQNGVPTINSYFTSDLAQQIRVDYGSADLILANNVIANIDDLEEVFGAVKDLLKPQGLFVMETGYIVDEVENMVFDHIYHEHLSYFAVKPLVSFLAAQGLQLYDAQPIDTKGGSLRMFVQLQRTGRQPRPSVQAFMEREIQGGYDQPGVYLDFQQKIDQVKLELGELLEGLANEGKRIAGYGASPSVTTMVHHFDISKYIEFLVDDNERKHDTFSPGHHIPVKPSSELYVEQPDYVIVLPWRFSDMIIGRHRKFLDAGGHFITYLPSVKVI